MRKKFSQILMDPTAPFEKVKADVYPHQYAAVIIYDNDELILTAKRYSLTPSWSKDEKVKWATYNARMKRENPKTGEEEFIYQVPSWKSAFGKRHCLVPLNGFRESCHGGKAEGHIVDFQSPEEDILFAAGIYEDWINKNTGEVISTFAIITTEPDDYIQSIGHDRSPVFLNPDAAQGWLRGFKSPKAAYKYLEDFLVAPELHYNIVRKLKTNSSHDDSSLLPLDP